MTVTDGVARPQKLYHLKDASAFNIQFVAGRPLLIDTLSLEKYREGMPWIAYRQYCEHFLAPPCADGGSISENQAVSIDEQGLVGSTGYKNTSAAYLLGRSVADRLLVSFATRTSSREGESVPFTLSAMG